MVYIFMPLNALNKFQEILEMVKLFMGKILSSVIIFTGINYSPINIFVNGQKFRHFLPTKFSPIRYAELNDDVFFCFHSETPFL